MPRSRNPEIYVKGYGKSTNKDDLKSLFREYGKIICIQFKGPYSFIEFEDYYDAEYAVKEMHDKKIEGGYRLTVEPSGLKKGKKKQRSRSRSRSKYKRRRRRSVSSSSSSSSSYSSSDSSSGSDSSSSVNSDSSSSSCGTCFYSFSLLDAIFSTGSTTDESSTLCASLSFRSSALASSIIISCTSSRPSIARSRSRYSR